jgi:phosphate transport system permease protein
MNETGINEPIEITRRDQIQAIARASYRRRQLYSRMFLGLLGLALVVAFVPLFSIVQNVVGKGLQVVDWAFITTPQQLPGIIDPHAIGGISNAITGTILIDLIGLAIAIPIAILLSIAFYESDSRLVGILRIAIATMVGLPSILFGIFIFTMFVKDSGHFTGWAGALAIGLMMVPLMTVACEAAMRDVPPTLNEAALALGARRSRIMFRVILPYALPRMMTGILLSLSRAVGETAPVLLIIGANLVTNWNPKSPQTTLPTLVYSYIPSQYPAERYACWGIALVLITAVFIISVTSRAIAARSSKRR